MIANPPGRLTEEMGYPAQLKSPYKHSFFWLIGRFLAKIACKLL